MQVYKSVQYLCYVCALAFLGLMLLKRSTLQLSEVESLTTLMLIFCGSLLFVCVGTLSGLAGLLEVRRARQDAHSV